MRSDDETAADMLEYTLKSVECRTPAAKWEKGVKGSWFGGGSHRTTPEQKQRLVDAGFAAPAEEQAFVNAEKNAAAVETWINQHGVRPRSGIDASLTEGKLGRWVSCFLETSHEARFVDKLGQQRYDGLRRLIESAPDGAATAHAAKPVGHGECTREERMEAQIDAYIEDYLTRQRKPRRQSEERPADVLVYFVKGVECRIAAVYWATDVRTAWSGGGELARHTSPEQKQRLLDAGFDGPTGVPRIKINTKTIADAVREWIEQKKAMPRLSGYGVSVEEKRLATWAINFTCPSRRDRFVRALGRTYVESLLVLLESTPTTATVKARASITNMLEWVETHNKLPATRDGKVCNTLSDICAGRSALDHYDWVVTQIEARNLNGDVRMELLKKIEGGKEKQPAASAAQVEYQRARRAKRKAAAEAGGAKRQKPC